ncbi:MAG: hypothetical protein WC835_01470 [Candidatus Paceibacterota bacterium]|jgi:hypothetical protein
MSRNTFIWLFIGILILGIAGLGVYFYYFTDTFGIRIPRGSTGANQETGFSPFGGTTESDTPRTDTAKTDDNSATNTGTESRLMKLVQNPVAGFISTTIGSTTLLRYLERETGKVSDIDMDLPRARTRVTNTTIPRVYQALFGAGGSSVLLRYLDGNDTVQTYFANIPNATSTEDLKNGVELKGSYLAEGIRDISVSPSGTKIFTLTNFTNTSVGIVSNPDGSKKSQIFSSPFTEWLSSWTNEKTIILTTKPSGDVPGYSYSLDATTGNMQKVYGGAGGLLSALSPDGKKLLTSETSGGVPSLKIHTVGGNRPIDTGLKTIADKCVWATNVSIYCSIPENMPPNPGTGYPDAWYQGLVSFSDSIWEINSVDLSTEEISPISSVGREPIDGVSLSTDKNGRYLFFLNKRDGALWSLKL